MKTLFIIIMIAGFIGLISCENKSDKEVNTMLADPVTRGEIFKGIVDNPDRMTSFMEYMQKNDHAMQMMQSNEMMMSHMMQDKGMQMIMKDQNMRNNMMQTMMIDSLMMNNMLQKMHQNGMLSDECMETMKNRRGNKGMKMNANGIMYFN